MADVLTAEEIAAHFSAMDDSVDLIKLELGRLTLLLKVANLRDPVFLLVRQIGRIVFVAINTNDVGFIFSHGYAPLSISSVHRFQRIVLEQL